MNNISTAMLLGQFAGSYLRNVRRDIACSICGGAMDPKYAECWDCKTTGASLRLAAAGFVTYAASGNTTGTTLHGYKSGSATAKQTADVKLMLAFGVEHSPCAGRIAGVAIDSWSFVPSTSGRVGGALRACIPRMSGHEVVLRHTGVASVRKTVQGSLFEVVERRGGQHCLLIDDTWVTGNRAQSAAEALMAGGVERVSILCAARWIKFDFLHADPGGHPLLQALRRQSVYSLDICPFTGGDCPPF